MNKIDHCASVSLCCSVTKTNGVTIQSVIEAASLKAAAQLIKSRATGNTWKLGSDDVIIAPQLFKHLPPDTFPDDVSKISSLFWTMTNKFDMNECADKDFWPLAKQVFETNRKSVLTSLQQTPVIFSLFGTEGMPDMIMSMNGKRMSLFSYTNHGDCSWVNSCAQGEAHVKVTGVFSHVYQSRPVGPVFGHFVSTISGRFFWCVTYSNDVMDEASAREHLQESVRILLEACSPTENAPEKNS